MANGTNEYHEQLDLARRLAREAAGVIMPFFRSVAVEHKSDGTEVTEADRRAEERIRAEIARIHPKAAVLGEEFGGDHQPVPGDQWIIDPLDGTASFVLGLPTFGTLVGLLRDGDPVVGVVHMPALGETVYAAMGAGCWFELKGETPKRLQCDPVGSLDKAFVSAGGLHGSVLQPLQGRRPYPLDKVVAGAMKFRVVSDCVQHLLVCRQRLHVAIDPVVSPWDSAALVPCLREANGVVSDLTGDETNVVFAGSLLSAADRALHREVTAIITAA